MATFEKISEHIWIMHAEHGTDRPILAAIAGEKRTLLMDAGNSPAHAKLFHEELIRQGVRLPDLLVLTHWHWDHSFGLPTWNVPVVAHAKTALALAKLSEESWSRETLDRLAREQVINEHTVAHITEEYGEQLDITIIRPDVVFEDRLQFDLGGVTCEIRHVGGDHTEDSCILYVNEDRVLFVGDSLGPSVYGGPRTYTVESFLGLLETTFSYDTGLIVESHGAPLDKEAFRKEIEPWEQLARLVQRHGHARETIAAEMCSYLQATTLPAEFAAALEWFLTGLGHSNRTE
ncbi:MAG: MBL fold metallo-hydrolase [Clostridia bacterium]